MDLVNGYSRVEGNVDADNIDNILLTNHLFQLQRLGNNLLTKSNRIFF